MPLYSPTVPLPFSYRSPTERYQYRHGSRWGDGTIGNNPSPLRGSHTTPHLPRGYTPTATFRRPYGAPHTTPHLPRGLTPTATFRRPYGAPIPHRTFSWACALGYFPSPLRGSYTTPNLPRGLAPTATFPRPYGAPIPQRTFPVGLRPRLLSVAPTGLPTVSPTLKPTTHNP